MSTKIKVEHLTKIFGQDPEKALDLVEKGDSKDAILEQTGHTVGVYDVSFDVSESEFFVIMGLSGSGKSTLIRCLNMLNRPTAGKVIVNGEDIVPYSKKTLSEFRQNNMAMVFQHFGLFSHRSILTNVAYGLEVKGISQEEREETAKQVLKTVGLEGWEQKRPGELSGGMQQRVGLARALATDPDILLMDEPFSALDPLIRREMQLELLDIQAKLKKTIIFITHDVNEAFQLGDRVAVMKDGVMEQIGTPEEVLETPKSDYIKEFVKDIDKTKVLQAQNVMLKPSAIVPVGGGPKLAIEEMRNHGISSVFVIGENKKLEGLVTIDDAMKANKENQSLKNIVKSDYPTTDPETYIEKLIPIATEAKYPIAVVDNDERLVGYISRVSVLASLV
ncbi:glycine betaine/L-proline ABC transporter ATP-binding protein [Salicibibacter cibarius]|uniref:Quaternary amine transport ATP-binding protein n=1 Tax=Salicibibacter cibarius TaxID=2743000 RepID=A0A7T6Z3K7_9BACI|nr:glycine betaine/L-proline ABC transporter ATP-binding protein [Salicibibacter cibarius]QQK76240.1 glycine betaine/L-proline ABC transporter ATP-binding protein [Salicibibacter cibarius]